jgi:hypothetical protein
VPIFWSRYLGNRSNRQSTQQEKEMKILVLVASMAIPVLAYGQSAMSCPMHEPHQQATDQHTAGVDTRGDHTMGFSHDKSAHHFHLLPDGGTIEVVADDANDAATRDEIRMHLSQDFTNDLIAAGSATRVLSNRMKEQIVCPRCTRT